MTSTSGPREQLAALCGDILSRFTKGQDGCRARVGQVQIAKWQAALADLKPAAPPPVHLITGLFDVKCGTGSRADGYSSVRAEVTCGACLGGA